MSHKPVITQPDDTSVVIERTFDAPRDLVWKCWTQAEHMKKWFGPHIMTVPEAKSDLRPGGEWRIVMRDPKGVEFIGKGVYGQVQPPEHFTSTVDVTDHPDEWFDQIDPGRDRSKGKPHYELGWDIRFAETKDGKTTVTIRSSFPSKYIRDRFVKTGMNQGWSESLERFDAELARVSA
jgi:uncharacterized protein YndB with AHSA1/START domain